MPLWRSRQQQESDDQAPEGPTLQQSNSVPPPKQGLTRVSSTTTGMDITVETGLSSSDGNNSRGGGGGNATMKALRNTLTWKAVWTGRLVFIVGLVCVAAVLGAVTWFVLHQSEVRLAESQFEAIADRAIHMAQEIVVRKRLGTISMASVVSNHFSKANDWPFVFLPGYEEISTNIIDTSSGREMGFCPLVMDSQLEAFERHAYQWFQELREPPFPNGTAISSFGEGIWMPNPGCNCADNRSHVTTGDSTRWGGFNVTTPILQHNNGPHRALMLNLHFEPTRGTIIDNLITCSGCTVSTDDGIVDCSNAPPHANASLCGAVTDMLILTSQDTTPGPGALLMEPIYPARETQALVGLIASSIVWDESLRNVFSTDVSGVDCVLSTQAQVYTYGVENGIPFVRGEGDLHDDGHSEFKQEILLTPLDLFSNTSAIYKLELYPTDDFFETYSTRNPRVATIGAVCVIVFTAALFFLYDFCVRKEFDARKELLEAKRQFVRYISHEVRTPLNTVCMGLGLMQEEISGAMGLARPDQAESADEPQASQLKKEDFKDKQVAGDKAFEWLSLAQEVLNNAQASVDVLNDLLNYDKVSMGKLSLELSILSLWALLESTVREFKLAALERKINLQLDFSALLGEEGKELALGRMEAGLPSRTKALRVVGDTVRLSQVVRNLVSNGLKFTPEDGDLTVRVRIEPVAKDATVVEKQFKLGNGQSVQLQREGVVYCDVIDTGVGMTPDQVDKVFADGTQFNVNKLQAGKGSGLGLYIAKGICKQHGGSLTCTSGGLGHGTTFTMKLPVYHLPQTSGEDSTTAKASDAEGGDDRYAGQTPAPVESFPLRILVVDDSAPNLKLLTRMLQNRGHTCDGASNGQEAVNQVRGSGGSEEENAQGSQQQTTSSNLSLYDTILLDFEMPVMDGPTACSHMRKMGCSAFIVGITGNVLPEDVAHFKRCGANAVLPKPFKLAALEQLWTEYGISGVNPALLEEAAAASASVVAPLPQAVAPKEPPLDEQQQQQKPADQARVQFAEDEEENPKESEPPEELPRDES